MEVLFAAAGCLGAFVLGALAAGRAAPPARRYPPSEPEDDLPPGLRRQWEDFLSYTGGPREEERDED